MVLSSLLLLGPWGLVICVHSLLGSAGVCGILVSPSRWDDAFGLLEFPWNTSSLKSDFKS